MKLIVIKGSGEEKEFRLHDGINTIGRGITNRIRLLDPRVSRKHCRIRKVGLSLSLSDLGTKNGTRLNGRPIVEEDLKVLDEIKVGKTVLKIVGDDYLLQSGEPNGWSGRFPNLLRILSAFRKTGKQSQDEFARFARRGRKRLWRPHVDTEPPEGESETVISHTDPDSP